jgi:hypothetical protein
VSCEGYAVSSRAGQDRASQPGRHDGWHWATRQEQRGVEFDVEVDVAVVVEVVVEVVSMKWPPSQSFFRTKLRGSPGACASTPGGVEYADVSKCLKELRAVAIEYSWSKPHRLESVEGATIGRTRSTGRRSQSPDTTSRGHLLWTAVARKAALTGEATER